MQLSLPEFETERLRAALTFKQTALYVCFFHNASKVDADWPKLHFHTQKGVTSHVTSKLSQWVCSNQWLRISKPFDRLFVLALPTSRTQKKSVR